MAQTIKTIKTTQMNDSMIICDVCGEEFSYPTEGQLQQGFGICDECGNK